MSSNRDDPVRNLVTEVPHSRNAVTYLAKRHEISALLREQNMGIGVQEQISQALVIANHVFAARFQGASCAFVAGSIMRGEGTPSSDIDLVVVFDHLDAARCCAKFSSLPAQAFERRRCDGRGFRQACDRQLGDKEAGRSGLGN